MKNKSVASVTLVVGLLMVCSAALAHHGHAAYNMDKLVEVKNATVTSSIWANPHCYMTFDAKDDTGNVQHWTVESGNPAALIPYGWEKDTVKTGDVVTFYLWQSKKGTTAGILNKVVFPDGRTFKDVPLGGTAADREEAKKQGITGRDAE